MKAIRCREWGAPDVLRLEEAQSPSLKPHQVRIRVHAAGVNFADSLMVGGTYQVKPPFPFTPGLEAAGEIVETGSAVDGLQAGQRVLAVLRNGGGYAEEIVLGAAAVVPIPDAMDFVTAAAFPVAYGTSHLALTHRGHLQPGETPCARRVLRMGNPAGGRASRNRSRPQRYLIVRGASPDTTNWFPKVLRKDFTVGKVVGPLRQPTAPTSRSACGGRNTTPRGAME
jgi:NADPH2:quinone reductase